MKEEDLQILEKYGKIKKNKHFVIIKQEKKSAGINKGLKVILEDYKKEYGESNNVKVFSEEEIKKRHSGKTKCEIKCASMQEVTELLDKYFQ